MGTLVPELCYYFRVHLRRLFVGFCGPTASFKTTKILQELSNYGLCMHTGDEVILVFYALDRMLVG
jgi:hypothetical protein